MTRTSTTSSSDSAKATAGRRLRLLVPLGLLAGVALALAAHGLGDGRMALDECLAISRRPNVRPDGAGATIPPNIAPLGFVVDEPGRRYCARIHGPDGREITVLSDDGRIRIPARPWRALLRANKGGHITVDVYAQARDGTWSRYQPFGYDVAEEAIDRYLVYRLIHALFNNWGTFSIRQRDLEKFDERLVVSNRSFGEGCVNCHTFMANDPKNMMLHTRGGTAGSSTILVHDGKAAKVNTASRFGLTGYTSWHPDGKLIVCAVVKVRQFFHTARRETRDVIDLDSTLVCYRVDEDRVETHPSLSRKDRLETYPCWSPDGLYLYFSSAKKLWSDEKEFPPKRFAEVRYDLMRVSYDVETDQWGDPETVLASADTGQSITQPRISPDGRWLLFCMADYGCFPIFQREADLYMMDLETRQYRRLGINSDECDSWHSWSSNGRWIVFSSKRGNGLWARPYISYVDHEGAVHPPVVLPQQDPAYYDSCILTYNVPELVTGPITVSADEFGRLIRRRLKGSRDAQITSASPPAPSSEAPPAER